jgi:hypothetical protein
MRRQVVTSISVAIVMLVALAPLAIAQQKTAAACRDEWRANKTANKAAGITEKAYVAQCRSGAAPDQNNTAAPASPPAIPTATLPNSGPKTAAACREEWRANKAANRAAGISEKAFVAQCRGGTAPTADAPSTPAATPAAPRERTEVPLGSPPSAPTAAPSAVGQKTVAACREEWRANKASNQAAGITEKAYVAQCRGGAATSRTTVVPPAPTSAPAPPPPSPAPTASVPPANPAPAPARPSTVAPNQLEANEFTTAAQAKVRCPADTVVWANRPSRIYHFGDTRFYGQTKMGAYMCERDALAAGMRAAKNETHP